MSSAECLENLFGPSDPLYLCAFELIYVFYLIVKHYYRCTIFFTMNKALIDLNSDAMLYRQYYNAYDFVNISLPTYYSRLHLFMLIPWL